MQTFETRLTLTKAQENLISGLCVAHSEGVRHALSATYRQGKDSKTVYAELINMGLTACQSISAQNVAEMLFKRQLEADKYQKTQAEKRILSLKKSISRLDLRLDKQKITLATTEDSAKKKIAEKSIKSLRQEIAMKSESLKLKERNLDILTNRLVKNKVKICFGSRTLLKQNPKINPESIYKTYESWRQEWNLRRNHSVVSIGKKNVTGGNPELQWQPNERVLRIRLTNAQASIRIKTLSKMTGLDVERGVGHKFAKYRMMARFIEIPNVDFAGHHGQARQKIMAAQGKLPLTAKIVIREGGKFYLHISVARQDSAIFTTNKNGALGVDFNVKGVAWSVVKPDGNLKSKQQGFIPWNIQKQKSGTTNVEIGTVAKKLAEIAKANNVAMAIENLDFADKKANKSKRTEHNAMLSTLATQKFVKMIEKQCLDFGIGLYLINPRYSSIGGFSKFGRFSTASVDEAASHWIGRQAIFGETYKKQDMSCVKHGVKLHKEKCIVRGLKKGKQSIFLAEKLSWPCISSRLGIERKLWKKNLKIHLGKKASPPSTKQLAQRHQKSLDQKTRVSAVHEKLCDGANHCVQHFS